MTTLKTLTELSFEYLKDTDALQRMDKPNALAQIPNFHAKYSDLCGHYVFAAIQANAAYKEMKLLRFKYYRGDLNADTEVLKANGWVPLQKKIDASHIKEHIEGDDKLIQLKCQSEQYQELADYCRRAMESFKNRSIGLNAVIKYQMWQHDASE